MKQLLEKNEINWGEELNTYQNSKKSLEWKVNIKPPYILDSVIKENDRYFNPVTQKYKGDLEHRIRSQEKSKIINALSKNFDKSLQFEQHFDILNLKSKLNPNIQVDNEENKPVENSSQELRIKNKVLRNKNYIQDSRINYNFFSNISLHDHNFEKPSERTEIKEAPPSKNGVKMFAIRNQKKDFNILSGDYLYDAEEKKQVDKQIQLLQAAKSYNASNELNIFTGKYSNPISESQYQNDLQKSIQRDKIKAIEVLPKSFREYAIKYINLIRQGMYYNSVNHQVLDNKGLKEYDKQKNVKIERYKQKHSIEGYQREKGITNEDRNENFRLNRLYYNQQKHIDNRGFDILSNNNQETLHKDIYKKSSITPWEYLNRDSHISSHVYKDRYDYADADSNFREYVKQRSSASPS